MDPFRDLELVNPLTRRGCDRMVDGQLDTFESLNSLESMNTYDYVQVLDLFSFAESTSIA